MENPQQHNSDILHSEINPNYIFAALVVLGLLIFPSLLMFLVPVYFIYAAHRSSVKAGEKVRVTKRRKVSDHRVLPTTFVVMAAALLVLYLNSTTSYGHNNFGEMVLMIGICTGGFIWFPIVSFALAKLFLFTYDKSTGNTKYEQYEDIDPMPQSAPAPTRTAITPPDLSQLSDSDQSLVQYIADGSVRGMTNQEMHIILKANGWSDPVITNGFALARLYYGNIVK
jgi:hypothetical protein